MKDKYPKYSFTLISSIISLTADVFSNMNYSKPVTNTIIISGGLISSFLALYEIRASRRKEKYLELKKAIINAIDSLNLPFSFKTSVAYYHIETKILFNHFRNNRDILKCLAEINPLFKTEHEILKLIRNNVPDLLVLKNDDTILAIIRFTGLNAIPNEHLTQFADDTPYLYDANGFFLGAIRNYSYIVNKEGIYVGELRDCFGYFYAEAYSKKGVIANIRSMPNIFFTENELQAFYNSLPDAEVKSLLPTLKPANILNFISTTRQQLQ